VPISVAGGTHRAVASAEEKIPMKRVSRVLVLASVLSTLAVAGCASDAATEADSTDSAQTTQSRPPQFVVLAFDGSLNLDFWKESRAFARDTNVKFTYFISGVYFIPNAMKSSYDAPHGLGPGKSAIGWGGTAENIALRYEQLEAAHQEGHEIGSHANGHFDGSRWTQADWESEFKQFDKIIWQGVGVTPDLSFDPTDSVGFRAPQLGYSAGLYPTLAAHGYQYDTSKTAATSYWPQQIGGVWNFPLAQLRIVGSNKKTLSMDYNFYIADSKAEPDAARKETYKKQMIDTYMAYFESNYFGNRAPVHIGHHFSKWNGGAYWEAMQTFARRVCGLPEVKCGTYKDLVAFVNDHKTAIPDYQAGHFTKMVRPPSSEPVDLGAPFSDEELAEVLQTTESHDDGDE
jgi:peptidoglycan/xylan/chitin deacetylase (PgdA/CDA1 family)